MSFNKVCMIALCLLGKTSAYLKIQRDLCGGIIFVSQGFRGSCLGGKLIAKFMKQAWNVCLISPKQGLQRPSFLV